MGTYALYITSFIVSAISSTKLLKWYDRSDKAKTINIIRKAFVVLLISIMPIFLASIRKNIGIDYPTYSRIFTNYNNLSFNGFINTSLGAEIGNYFLVKTGFFLFGDVQGVFALYAVLTIGLLTSSVIYYKDRISIFIGMLSMYLLYYSGSFNTVRQYLAIAFVIYGYRYIEQRKLFQFIIFIVLATLIHSTAIIMIFVYYLYNPEYEEIKQRVTGWRRILLRMAVVVLILSPILLSNGLSVISNIPLFSRYFDVYESSSIDITTSIILKLPVYIPLVLAYRRNVSFDKRNNFYYILLLLEFELLLTSSVFKWGFRLSYYSLFGQIILVGASIKSVKDTWNKILRAIYYMTWYLIQFWILYFVWQRDAITPFIHIFM